MEIVPQGMFAYGNGSTREFRLWGWFCKDVSLIVFFAEVDGVNSQIFNAIRVIIWFCSSCFLGRI